MSKDKKNIHFNQVTENVNHETGEIISTERKTVVQVDREPEYVKLYVKDIVRLNGLPNSTASILNALLRSMGYNNIIPAYAPVKKIICRDLGIKINTLNKAIDSLYKKNILIRLDRGIYMADPEIFGRGTWGEIKEIRMMISYNEAGQKVIKSEIKKEQLKLF